MPPILLDLVLFGVLLEAGVLFLALKRRAPALIPAALLFLASGGALLSAVRLSLAGAAAPVLSLTLLAGGVLHVCCLLALRKAWRSR